MYFSRTSILTIALSTLAWASPMPSSLLQPGIESLVPRFANIAHEIGVIDLDTYEDNTALGKRTDINYCWAGVPAQTANCVALGALAGTVAQFIATLVKTDSNNNDCSTHTGGVDGVVWSVHATGRNCDTTAQLSTIQGAVANYIDSQGDEICGVKCIKMTHGGTWTGFVTIAPAVVNPNNYYCGEAYAFGHCGTND